jgi:hypothetical protein
LVTHRRGASCVGVGSNVFKLAVNNSHVFFAESVRLVAADEADLISVNPVVKQLSPMPAQLLPR